MICQILSNLCYMIRPWSDKSIFVTLSTDMCHPYTELLFAIWEVVINRNAKVVIVEFNESEEIIVLICIDVRVVKGRHLSQGSRRRWVSCVDICLQFSQFLGKYVTRRICLNSESNPRARNLVGGGIDFVSSDQGLVTYIFD